MTSVPTLLVLSPTLPLLAPGAVESWEELPGPPLPISRTVFVTSSTVECHIRSRLSLSISWHNSLNKSSLSSCQVPGAGLDTSCASRARSLLSWDRGCPWGASEEQGWGVKAREPPTHLVARVGGLSHCHGGSSVLTVSVTYLGGLSVGHWIKHF